MPSSKVVEEEGKNSVQKLTVPIGIAATAVAVTISIIYAIDARIDLRVEAALAPMRVNQTEVLRKLDEVRQTVARIEGRMDFLATKPIIPASKE